MFFLNRRIRFHDSDVKLLLLQSIECEIEGFYLFLEKCALYPWAVVVHTVSHNWKIDEPIFHWLHHEGVEWLVVLPIRYFGTDDGLLLVNAVTEHDGYHRLDHHESVNSWQPIQEVAFKSLLYKNFHHLVYLINREIEYFAEIFAVQVLLTTILLKCFKEFFELLAVEVVHLTEHSPSVEEIRL